MNSDTLRMQRRRTIGGGIVALLAVAHVANDAITSMLAALLPTLQQRFSLSEATLALMVAVFSFSSSVTQPLFGALSDRVGRRPLAVVGLILSAALLSLMAVAPSVGSLFALLVVGGLGSAAFHPTGTSIARSASSNKELAVGMFSAGGMLGLALGPVAALAVAAVAGLEYTPWLMIPGVVLGIVLNVVAPKGAPRAPATRATVFDVSILRGPVGALAATAVLMEIAFVTFASGLPLWLVSEHGVEPGASVIGLTLSTFYVAAAAGGAIAGILTKRLPRRSVITTALGIAPLPLFATFALEPGSALYYGAIALAGALVNASFPLLIVEAQERAPHAEATVSGILMGSSVGIAGVLYVAIGWLQGVVGFTGAMSVGYLALVPAALMALRALRTGAARAELRRCATGCVLPEGAAWGCLAR
jgi:FSR family fosmidomycin resistance protein-like MFS transporter